MLICLILPWIFLWELSVSHPKIVTPTNILHTLNKENIENGEKKAKSEQICLINFAMHIRDLHKVV